MASTNQTPHYNLPQFLSSDKPSWLGDINPAFLDIDTQLFTLASDASDASSSAAAAQQSAQESQTAAELAQTQAQTATENVAKLDTKVTSLEQSYTGLAAQQNTQGSEINVLKSDVDTLQTQVQSAQTTANAAQTAASNAQATATSAQTKASNIRLTYIVATNLSFSATCQGLLISSNDIMELSTVSKNAGIHLINGQLTLSQELTLNGIQTQFFNTYSHYGDNINTYATSNGITIGYIYSPNASANFAIQLRLDGSTPKIAIHNQTSVPATLPAGNYFIF